MCIQGRPIFLSYPFYCFFCCLGIPALQVLSSLFLYFAFLEATSHQRFWFCAQPPSSYLSFRKGELHCVVVQLTNIHGVNKHLQNRAQETRAASHQLQSCVAQVIGAVCGDKTVSDGDQNPGPTTLSLIQSRWKKDSKPTFLRPFRI